MLGADTSENVGRRKVFPAPSWQLVTERLLRERRPD